ncbi:MAG: amino acid transporter [Alphaproteobacteria bacterium]|nr:MAG: amino acid transporter [Alphaproteobacteria bacterium]
MTPTQPALRRVLGTPLLIFYGLGVIIGAGIYVLVGTVIGAAGAAAPWAFVLAGALAGLTGLSYAELAVRFPEAAGAAAYVKEAFGSDRLSQLTGLAVAAVVVVSTASIARGSIGYVQVFLPLPGAAIAGGVVLLFTAVACLGVRESVGMAAVMTAIEVGGLLLVLAAGWQLLGAAPVRLDELVPAAPAAWAALVSGAFLAFFAFIGFENLANMAEEARDPERSLPRAILASLGISAVLYAAVTAVAILAVPAAELAASAAPLLLMARHAAWFSPEVFSAIAIVAVANGVLIEIVMLGRLLYGMARRGLLPRALAAVASRQRTPVRATILGGAVIFVLTVTLPFVSLVVVSSTITLLVFAVVNVALWRLQTLRPRSSGFRVPRAIPPIAAVANVALATAQLLG